MQTASLQQDLPGIRYEHLSLAPPIAGGNYPTCCYWLAQHWVHVFTCLSSSTCQALSSLWLCSVPPCLPAPQLRSLPWACGAGVQPPARPLCWQAAQNLPPFSSTWLNSPMALFEGLSIYTQHGTQLDVTLNNPQQILKRTTDE